MSSSQNNLQVLFNGLVWHLECMKLASVAIDNFRPAADPFEMRMHHSLYVTNLFSAIDMVGDAHGRKQVGAALARYLAIGTMAGTDVLGYLRELRNSVVHRGLDPTEGGVVVGGRVCALAPPVVTNAAENLKYEAPCPLLRDVFMVCDGPVKRVLKQLLEPQMSLLAEAKPEMLLADTHYAIDAAHHMPEWVKSAAAEHLTTEMLVSARNARISKLESLFLPWAM